MKNFTKILIPVIVSFFITSSALGAPVSNVFTNIIPAANQTYDNGTTTPAREWKNVYTKNLTISGTCVGCGAGTFSFTPTTNFGNLANSTSTQMWFRGAPYSLSASSTSIFDYASTTAFTNTGNAYLGTVTSGLWNGTTIGVGYGGTGQTSFTSSNLLYGNGTGALQNVATTTLTASSPLSLSQPISVIGSAGSVLSLSTAGDWTGTFDGQEGTYYLARANHTGTQGVSTLSNYDWTFDKTYNANNLTASTSIPVWVKGQLNASSTAFIDGLLTVPYASTTAETVSGSLYVTPLTSALILTGADGLMAKYTGTTCTNQFARALSALGVATCATVSLTADVTGILPIANGGTNASSFTITNNGVAWNGTSLITAPLTSAITYPYASTTAISASGSAYFATSGGSVGIGTTSPASPLTLAGSSGTTAIRVDSTATNGAEAITLSEKQGSSNTGYLQYINSAHALTARQNDLELFNTSAGGIGFYTNNNSDARMKIANGGNVGIGTTTPANSLNVYTGSADSSAIKFHGNGITIGGGYLYSGNSENGYLSAGGEKVAGNWTSRSTLSAGTANAALLGINAGAIEIYQNTGLTNGNTFTPTLKHVFAANGNVGIGETAPSQLLSLKFPTATANAITDVLSIYATTTAGNTPALGHGGGLSFYTSNTGAGGRQTRAVIGGVAENVTANSEATGLNFFTATGGSGTPLERMRITAAGKLGVGTTTPQAKFDVQDGVIRATATSDPTSPAYGAGLEMYYSPSVNQADILAFDRGAAAYKTLQLRGDKILLSNGEVGVGLTPTYRFEVQQPTDDTTIAFQLRGYTTGADGARTVNMRAVSSNNNNWANLATYAYNFNWFANNTQQMVLTNAGRLGIGTTSPATPLDIFSTATTSVTIDSNHASRGSCLVMKDRDGSGYTYITANNGVLTADTVSCK